jgi:hypothetical protein
MKGNNGRLKDTGTACQGESCVPMGNIGTHCIHGRRMRGIRPIQPAPRLMAQPSPAPVQAAAVA